jgi:hypothetical protein
VSVETYYSVLGVAETATQQEIKAAYRKLVRQVHPDSLPGASADWKRAAEEKTKEINEAYGVLSDSTMRREYDRLLKEARRATYSRAAATWSTPPNQPASPPPASRPRSATPYCSKCGGALYKGSYCPQCYGFATSSAAQPSTPKYPAWKPTGGTGWLIWCLILIASFVIRHLNPSAPQRVDFEAPQNHRVPILWTASNPELSRNAYPMQWPQITAEQLAAATSHIRFQDHIVAGYRWPDVLKEYGIETDHKSASTVSSSDLSVEPMACVGEMSSAIDETSILKPFDQGQLPMTNEENLSMKAACWRSISSDSPVTIYTDDGSRTRYRFPAADLGEMQSIQSACANKPLTKEPAGYNGCLELNLWLAFWSPNGPDLSGLSNEEKRSIEPPCSNAKRVQGPAAHDGCLVR